MLVVKCKVCGKELTSTTKVQCCGCPNMMKVVDDKVGAMNLGEVIIISDYKEKKSKLSASDMEWQESRKKRKVRKLDFEIR
tara:strand:+ start:400 stop:642 length:243 start_codon:yes stop_codon:yes gene_type:complete